jgi:putative restriction endonuclease
MRYWWVSQNKTFHHEVGGGYLWSPITNNVGQRNAAYDFMTEITEGDVIFSFAGTEIRAVGIALGGAFESAKPTVFGAAGDTWSALGWKVPVEFTRMEAPIKPAQHMEILAPLLPEKYSPIRANGAGNQQYLFPVPDEMAHALLSLMGNPYLPRPGELLPRLDSMALTDTDRQILSEPEVSETQKQSLVLARRGQGLFRNRVRVFEPRCRVTGVSSDKLLIASHIKPWSQATNDERLDGNNGLFLSPHIDKLFDSGFITFSAKGTMKVSGRLDRDVLPKWSIDPGANVGSFSKDQAYFLEYHEAHVLQP